ncbi:MAG: TrbI/VirB10 family protein, partial [Burkholderiales bacterium]
HFWDRWGAAVMMTMIGGTIGIMQNQASSGNNNFINQSNPGLQSANDLALKMVEPTISLPATLTKHRGERVSIYVARDLDFRGVYELKKAVYK